jgi:hypothetical protein
MNSRGVTGITVKPRCYFEITASFGKWRLFLFISEAYRYLNNTYNYKAKCEHFNICNHRITPFLSGGKEIPPIKGLDRHTVMVTPEHTLT